ncbi:hypothetical protein ACFQE7_11070 [Nonomuraea ferruginea]|uniref:hypothetical protein n=1 Tax=Nonomuraea ferruginea TaxID=46174 RepID=UPI00361EE65F
MELLGDRVVDRLGARDQIHALAATVAVAAHGDGGRQPGRGVIPHRIEDRQVHRLAVEGVVEGVPTRQVRRLQHRAHYDSVVGDGSRRHQRPQDFGRQIHRRGAYQSFVGVAGLALAHQQHGQQRGQGLHPPIGGLVEKGAR